MEELRPDIEAAKRAMSHRMGSGREIKRLTGYLWEHEQVRLMASGAYASGTGLIVLTDRRLLFVRDGITSQTSEDVVLERITSVQWSAGMSAGTLIVFASGNRVEIKNLNKVDGKRMAETLRAITSGFPGAEQVGAARSAESPHVAPRVSYPQPRPEMPTTLLRQEIPAAPRQEIPAAPLRQEIPAAPRQEIPPAPQRQEIPAAHGDALYGRAALTASPQHQDLYYPPAGRHDFGYQYRPQEEGGYPHDQELGRGYPHDPQPEPPISWTQPPPAGVPVSPAVGWTQPSAGVPVSPAVGWTQPSAGVPVAAAEGRWDPQGRVPDAYDLLRMVDTLHVAGILNDQEVAAKRAYLLDRR